MFRIGEFSKLTQVTIRMLRYYDETGLLKPAYIDPWTGYRMYSTEQLPRLNKIIYLRDSGFQVTEIAKLLEYEQDSLIAEQIDNKYDEIQKTIQAEQEKLRKLAYAKKQLLNGKNEMHYNISIKNIPAFQVLSLRRIIPDYYREEELWKELSSTAARHHIPVSDTTFSIYHDMEYKEQNVDVEICALVKKTGGNADNCIFRITEPEPRMASTMAYGPFSNIAGAYLAFADWLENSGKYCMSGKSRQIVHRGPWNEENPEKYLTEIQIPLE